MSADLVRRIAALAATGSEPLIVSGGIGAGKTTQAAHAARQLTSQGVKVGGVLAPRILKGNQTIGYQITDLMTGETRPFAGLSPPGVEIGRYFIEPVGLAFATEALATAVRTCRVVFVDEVGRLEVAGKGLAAGTRALLASDTQAVLLVRDAFVFAVAASFGLTCFENIVIQP